MAADRRHRDPARAHRAGDAADLAAELVVAPDAVFEPDRAALGALASAPVPGDAPDVDPELTREFWGDEERGRRRRRRDSVPPSRAARPSEPVRAEPPSQTTRAVRSTEGTRAVRATRELRMSRRATEHPTRSAQPPDPTTRRTGPVPRPWVDGRPPTPPDAARPPEGVVRADSDGDSFIDDPHIDVVPARHRGAAAPFGLDAVDPLLRRLGVIVLIGVLAVPFALALRSSEGDPGAGVRTIAAGERADVFRLPAAARAATTAGHAPSDAASGAGVGDEIGADPSAETGAAEFTGASGTVTSADATADVSSADVAAAGDGAPVCALEYTIVPGDYWLRLAEGAEVPLADLLRANTATIETVIHPGDRICLPEGARTPPPPPTTTTTTTTTVAARPAASGGSAAAPVTTAAPRSTTPSTTAPSTTAPSTTAAPATTAPAAPSRPPTSSNPSADAVRAIIREVWPADQHEMAFNVARRESNFRANAYNGWCCHGVFQIHWNAHRGWLRDVGITSVEQLYDARTNVEIAYQIYQRAGGWGPWRQTAY